MSGETARDALSYAIDDELLKLYATVVVGVVFVLIGPLLGGLLTGGLLRPVAAFVSVLGTVAGAILVLVGMVAIAQKVIVDST